MEGYVLNDKELQWLSWLIKNADLMKSYGESVVAGEVPYQNNRRIIKEFYVYDDDIKGYKLARKLPKELAVWRVEFEKLLRKVENLTDEIQRLRQA